MYQAPPAKRTIIFSPHIGKIDSGGANSSRDISMHMTVYTPSTIWISHRCNISQFRCRDKRGDKKFAASALQVVRINGAPLSTEDLIESFCSKLTSCFICGASQLETSRLKNSSWYYLCALESFSMFCSWTKLPSLLAVTVCYSGKTEQWEIYMNLFSFGSIIQTWERSKFKLHKFMHFKACRFLTPFRLHYLASFNIRI